MRTEELGWLVALVREPNLTRVAAAHNISQPALSRALRRIEAEAGAPLFDRIGRGLEPNPRGRLLAAHAARALQELRAGIDAVHDAVDPEGGEVHLGFLHTFGTWLIPDLVSAFGAAHPNVALRLRQDAARTLVDELIAGRHDLLITSPDPQDARLVWTGLFNEPLVLLVPPSHRLAGRRRVALDQVREDPFVLMQRGNGLRALTDALCAAAGFTPRIAFEGDDVETLRGLVGAGLGVTVAPARPTGRPEPGAIGLSDRLATRTVGLCVHRERARPAAADALAAFLRRMAVHFDEGRRQFSCARPLDGPVAPPLRSAQPKADRRGGTANEGESELPQVSS